MSQTPVPVGDRLRDRRALAAVAGQFFVNGVVLGSVVPRLPEIRDQVGITASAVGFMMSIAALGGLVGSVTVGPAIGRFGTRRVMVYGSSVVALALAVIGLATEPIMLAVGLVLLLSFDVPVDVAMNLQGSWLSGRRSTPVMSRLHGLWSLGTVIGGVVSSQLARAGVALSPHLLAASFALLVLVAGIGRWLLIEDESHERSQDPSTGATDTEAPAPRMARARQRAGPVLLILAVAGYTASAAEATSIDWSAFRFRDDLGTEPSLAALAYVAVTGGMTIGRLLGDWVAAALGVDRLITGASVTTGLALTAALLVDDPVVGLIGYLVAGLGIATFLPELYDRAARLPGRTGAGLGSLTAGLRVAALTVPLLIGLLIPVVGSIGTAVAVCALPAVAAFGLVFRSTVPR